MPAKLNTNEASSGDAGWTLMGAHGKPDKFPPVAELPKFTEMPSPPPKLVSPVATTPVPLIPPVPAPIKLISNQHVSQNDGTLRVTVKWNPTQYASLLPTDGKTWASQATDLHHFLFITAPDCYYHPWNSAIDEQKLPMLALTPDNIYDYISPTITSMDSKFTFVFGVRVSMCSGGSPGPWINNQATQASMFTHELISVSPMLPVIVATL